MGDPKQRSAKRFSGKWARGAPLKNFTLFLDESFDYGEVKQELVKANIKHRVYSEFFQRSEEDCNMLPLIGRRGWAMLTCDKRNRRRGLERKGILVHRVRQFVFQGNLGGIYMGGLLVRLYPALRNFSRKHPRPFVAIVTKAGEINLRMDKDGNLHGREAEDMDARLT